MDGVGAVAVKAEPVECVPPVPGAGGAAPEPALASASLGKRAPAAAPAGAGAGASNLPRAHAPGAEPERARPAPPNSLAFAPATSAHAALGGLMYDVDAVDAVDLLTNAEVFACAPGEEDEVEYELEMGEEGLMRMMSNGHAHEHDTENDLLNLIKSGGARRPCPEYDGLNPAAAQQGSQRLAAKPRPRSPDGSRASLDRLLLSSSPELAARAGVGAASASDVNDEMASELLPNAGSEQRISLAPGLTPGLIAGLAADGGWDLAGAKGATGLNFSAADADLLTHMVPKTPPRKKCAACNELNPTARQSCISCGAKFQMRPKRSAASTADEDAAGGARVKRECAPAAEGAPASSKLRAPRKKCSACHAFNPTAQQACQACGARFTIKSKAKQQSKANKEQNGAAALGGLQLPLGTPLALGSLSSALAAGGVQLPSALSALGASPELQAQLLGGTSGRAAGPHVTLGADGRLHFHDAPNAGHMLDLQAILNASSVLSGDGGLASPPLESDAARGGGSGPPGEQAMAWDGANAMDASLAALATLPGALSAPISAAQASNPAKAALAAPPVGGPLNSR